MYRGDVDAAHRRMAMAALAVAWAARHVAGKSGTAAFG
jgi:hypothetical protein